MWTITLRHSPLLPAMQPEDTTLAMIERITTAMADLLHNRLGVELADAVMLMSAVGQVRVSQMVAPLRTVRFEMPKSAYEPRFGPLL